MKVIAELLELFFKSFEHEFDIQTVNAWTLE